MKKNDPKLQLFLVSSSPDTPSRDYLVSDWAEVIRRIGSQAKSKTESVSQNTLQVA
jgi:hypothetical protein